MGAKVTVAASEVERLKFSLFSRVLRLGVIVLQPAFFSLESG